MCFRTQPLPNKDIPVGFPESGVSDLTFERLLADLSARFVGVADGNVDEKINDAMAAVCMHLGLDVCALWQADAENCGEYRLTHYFIPSENFPPVPERMVATESFPWSVSMSVAKKVFFFSDLSEAPAEAELDRKGWEHFGLKNILNFPLAAGESAPFGIVSFHDITEPRRWTPEIVNRLSLVTGVFAAALLRKQSWNALRESEERLHLALEASTAGVWVFDASRDTFRLGQFMSALLGVSPRLEITREEFFAMVHADDRQRARHALGDARYHKAMVEYRLARAGETTVRWMQSLGSFKKNQDGGAVMGITLDITDRKRMEIDAQELRRDLAHVTRTSMMGELAASISHELNQPLAAILSNAQAARRFLAAPEPDLREVRAIVEDIIQADKRAAGVIQRLRTLFLKNHREPPQILDLNAVVVEVLEILHSELIARETAVELALEAGLPGLYFSRIDLQQILLNLVMNALDAMKDFPRRILISTSASGEGIFLSLRDSGPGIAEHLLADIFRPYFSTKATGMGMGLAVARSMMESQGGRIWAENSPGGGAVFRLDFAKPPPSAEETPS